jgi:aryl-alcohol dehydrogenase-like predicted oxidoreductase
MEYAKVNGLNRKASRIGLGTWSIGGFMWGGTDEQAALETIRVALEHGIKSHRHGSGVWARPR